MEYNESKEAEEADGNEIGISKDSKLYNALVVVQEFVTLAESLKLVKN